MSDLIPSIPVSEFKKLTIGQIRRLKSCELTADGEYLCTIICPQTDYIKLQVEHLAQLGNSVSGESLEQVLRPEEPDTDRAPMDSSEEGVLV